MNKQNLLPVFLPGETAVDGLENQPKALWKPRTKTLLSNAHVHVPTIKPMSEKAAKLFLAHDHAVSNAARNARAKNNS